MGHENAVSKLDRASGLIDKIKLRLTIGKLLPPNIPELKRDLAHSLALMVDAQGQMDEPRTPHWRRF
jgi:hypothetical protein